MKNMDIKPKMRVIDVDQLAARQLAFERDKKSVSDIRMTSNNPGLGKSVWKAAALLSAGAATLAAGQTLTKGWNATSKPSTISRMQAERDLQAMIQTDEQLQEKLDAAITLEKKASDSLQSIRRLLNSASVGADPASNKRMLQQASLKLEDFIHGPLAEKISASNRVAFLLDQQKDNLARLVANQAVLEPSPDSRLQDSRTYQDRIGQINQLLKAKEDEVSSDVRVRDTLGAELDVLLRAGKLMAAIEQYQSGELPHQNHVLPLEQYQLSSHVAKLKQYTQKPIVMDMESFYRLKNAGEQAFSVAKNDPSQIEFAGRGQSDYQESSLIAKSPRPNA